MKFGVADYGMNVWDGGLYDIAVRLAELKKIGFDGIERLEAVSEADALNRAAMYRRMGMEFTTCRGPSVQAGIEWTAGLGKDYVWLTPGASDREVEFDVFCRRSNRMAEICAGAGLRVALHNHMWQRVELQQEIHEFFRQCPGAGLVFDIGHLAAAGGDCVEIIEQYHDRICAVHLKDVVVVDDSLDFHDRKRIRFCELGGGNIGLDIKAVMNALIRKGYDGWIFIEHDTHLNDPLVDLEKSYRYLIDAGFSNKEL